MKEVKRYLVDMRNIHQIVEIEKELAGVEHAGLDIESEDSGKRVELLDAKDLIIDHHNSHITGLSIYPNECDHAYYINVAHADVANRIPWAVVEALLNSFQGTWVIHNAPFERSVMELDKSFILKKYVCTLQLAVSAYNEDQYPITKLKQGGLGEIITKFLPDIARHFAGFEKAKGFTHKQGQIAGKVLGKSTKSAYSYNGVVKAISYGYGLKQAIKSWFGYEMMTYEQCLNGKDHMGQLTGEEVFFYGCDDSIWCMRLFNLLMSRLQQENPNVIKTYYEQELPMCEVYAELKMRGLKVNRQKVEYYRNKERHNYAEGLRVLKECIQNTLPFPRDPIQKLKDREEWYAKNWERYRSRIEAFAGSPNSTDDFEQCIQVSSPVGNVWADEKKRKLAKGSINFTHYMVTRTLFYDLLELTILMDKGKVQSDAEARQDLYEDLKHELGQAQNDAEKEFLNRKLKVIEAINLLVSIDQRMKLYLNPYMILIDAETGRVYPDLSSMLNSRRMAMKWPNSMQLAKRGSSTYVRGFYEADSDEDVQVSADWSQIELVLIGEFSGDPEFAKAYGKLPYEDLHLGAATDCLQVVAPALTLDRYKALKTMKDEDAALNQDIAYLFRSTNGEVLSPSKAYKYWRTEVGKGANFNYWYSGALNTVGERLGWTPDVMWQATERYRNRFAVAEQWRVRTIAEGQARGFVELPDHHRRYKYEATGSWEDLMRGIWDEYVMATQSEGVQKFANIFIQRIKTRANNQIVNSLIQGTCATLAKRSVIGIRKRIKADGFHPTTRFMIPVHDELVWNVKRREAWEFILMLREQMKAHTDIVKKLKIDCTVSIGNNYEPFSKDKAPYGQIEIDEAPALPFVPKAEIDGKMSRQTFDATLEYLAEQYKS